MAKDTVEHLEIKKVHYVKFPYELLKKLLKELIDKFSNNSRENPKKYSKVLRK